MEVIIRAALFRSSCVRWPPAHVSQHAVCALAPCFPLHKQCIPCHCSNALKLFNICGVQCDVMSTLLTTSAWATTPESNLRIEFHCALAVGACVRVRSQAMSNCCG